MNITGAQHDGVKGRGQIGMNRVSNSPSIPMLNTL